MRPTAYRQRGSLGPVLLALGATACVLTIGTAASYPPHEFLDEDGRIVVMDIDRFDAVPAQMGLRADDQNADFGTIIGSVGRTHDRGVSSFTINNERTGQVDMVSYLSAGTAWAVALVDVDAMLADLPVVSYAVRQSGGSIEQVGDLYDPGLYGYAVPMDDPGLSAALVLALEAVADDGTYARILQEWGQRHGPIDDLAVNP